MRGWVIGHKEGAAIVFKGCCFNEAQLRAMGIVYCHHGFETRKAAAQHASYLGYGHKSVSIGKLYIVNNGQHIS